MSKSQKRSVEEIPTTKPSGPSSNRKDPTALSTPPRQTMTTDEAIPPDTPVQKKKEDHL
jgi:hypothetical protein